MAKDYLVISTIGKESNHQFWLSSVKNFDLALVAYEDIKKPKCRYFFKKQGPRYHILKSALEKIPITKYKAIWILHENIEISASDIDSFFEIFMTYGLNVASPCFTQTSYVRDDFSRKKINTAVRYLNYVETICPIFEKRVLLNLLPTFDQNISGEGLCWVWPKILEYENCGVVDSLELEYHASTPLWKKFISDEIDVKKEEKELLKNYCLARPYYVQLSSIRDDTLAIPEISGKYNDFSSEDQIRMFYSFIPQLVNPKYFRKFSRPMRRAGKCSRACADLSARMINYRSYR